MLILVGVTINVALNGGLFTKARQAAQQTEIEVDRESLFGSVVASIGTDGKVNFTELDNNLPTEEWTGSNGTYTSPNGNTFTVDEYGNITYIGENSSGGGTQTTSDEDLVKDYFLGTSRTGRALTDLTPDFTTFVDDKDSITDASTTLTMITTAGGIAGEDAYIYVQYKDVKYKVSVDPSDEKMPTKTVTSLAYNTNGNIGKTATINGEKYIVLYDAGEQGDNVQLISANALDNVTLGYNDGQINWDDSNVITAANIFNDTAEGESVLIHVEKAIYSYNNAITNLNAKCKSVVGDANNDIIDVRSVGSNPTNKDNENTTPYTSTFLESNPSNSATYSAGDFDEKGKGTDQNYITDFDRMVALGINTAENSSDYWLASRVVDEDPSNVYFNVRYVNSDGGTDYYVLWNVYTGSASGNYNTRGVRPVVSLSSYTLSKYLDT